MSLKSTPPLSSWLANGVPPFLGFIRGYTVISLVITTAIGTTFIIKGYRKSGNHDLNTTESKMDSKFSTLKPKTEDSKAQASLFSFTMVNLHAFKSRIKTIFSSPSFSPAGVLFTHKLAILNQTLLQKELTPRDYIA